MIEASKIDHYLHFLELTLVKLSFNGKARRLSYLRLSKYLQHNMQLNQALTLIRDRYAERKSPLAKLFTAVLLERHNGHDLDKALASWIPHVEIMMIRGGIKGGTLDQALVECAELIEARSKIISALVSALAYPVFTFCLFLVLLLVLSFKVMPVMSQISSPETWPWSLATLYSLSSLIASPFGLGFFIFFLAIIFVILATLPYWTGKTRLIVENIPPWSIYRLVIGSVWLFTLATLLRSRIQLDYILKDMQLSGVMSPWLAERVRIIHQRYHSGINFGSLLLHLDMNFPDRELVEELAVYANLNVDFYNLAKEFLNDGVTRITQQARVLNSAAICAIGLLICLVTLGFTSISQVFNNGFGGF